MSLTLCMTRLGSVLSFFRKLQEITNKPRYFNCIRPLDPLTIIRYSETRKTHVVTSHAVQSTAAIRDRNRLRIEQSSLLETASVDGCQTAFSVNGNAVHTRQISVDADR